MLPRPKPDPVGEGQESVWDYPRPAICEPTDRHIEIIHRGVTLADTRNAWRTLETSHPPTYYIPPADIAMDHVTPNKRRSLCEWKGQARYHDVTIAGERLEGVAWSYPEPTAPFAPIRDHLAFYPEPFDACRVDGEQITPQPGGFYGGWISRYEAGPFKGIPGSRFW
ncbi:DUF427 domain-containing protein [Altererythrobacter aurantiacus]|uniref:DUF427 domain-containing protein n=1 Tax=Parapontixanthobacter aurantiacus TaxID=1463599 RepID=A0A844ZI12_9SPHN|nr:DUF427 domain-containing protein [Parapontixanthobacter aurantiacus]MXO87083.1 DUF427 domain-containing protein [Parapontixanthobacter aurantiacus]